MLASGRVTQLCSQLKVFDTLRSVEESLNISLDNQEHFFVLEGALAINERYVNGVSLTYGSPRQHIWTFANEIDEYPCPTSCPCTYELHSSTGIPSFVGNDYFCETGVPPGRYGVTPFIPTMPCGMVEVVVQFCTFNNPLWFCKQLPQSTS